MTEREKKALKLIRRCHQEGYANCKLIESDLAKLGDPNPTDDRLISMYRFEYQAILEAMQWQAEQCTNEFTKFHAERYPHTTQSTHDERRILNAGAEEGLSREKDYENNKRSNSEK